jgi:copper chaperone NosL
MKTGNTMTRLMKAATLISAVCILGALLTPIWRIELNAPQYPEGLVLEIWANKLSGDVDVINGLNHYIGMRHLHTEDFIEFTLLPYIVGGFSLAAFIVLLINRRKAFHALFILFLVIAVVAMSDFYRWEYDYGHELNPDAPIKVPGMAYQPPLIGYKKLLNFGAYSIPDTGGWIFVGVGLLLLTTWVIEIRKTKRLRLTGGSVAAIAALLFLSSCTNGPEAIRFGVEACDFCKMTIVDNRYACQLSTTKGKVFKFDDSHCLLGFVRNGGVWRNELKAVYFSDFSGKGGWIPSDHVVFLKSDKLHGPMGGDLAAFPTLAAAQSAKVSLGGESLSWKDISPVK